MTIIDLGTSTIPAIIDYVKDLFSDLSPLILLLLGVSLGFIIIESIISSIRKEK